jgi:predicted Zn-dependent protease
VRTQDGSGSGWAAAESFRSGAVDTRRITDRAIRKALDSQKPTPIEPGTYPVVLENSATGDMINLYRWNLGRRGADEGRSFFSDPVKGTKIGEKLFSEKITIYSDPMHPVVPARPWGDDGLPLGRTVWVDRGVQKNLSTGRYWAKEKGLQVVPWASNVIMEGEEHSLDELIASMDYGLLVTSFWYIRQVDPKTILYTGLTRDGVFLVEKGKITRPVIKDVEMMSRPERVVTREGNAPMLAPAIKVKEFHFTSVSTST